MANAPGNYDLVRALNSSSPVARRARLGDLLTNLINATNALAAQTDINTALANSTATNASGTVTAGGSVAAGNTWTLQLVNAALAALVTPGITVRGTAVTGETLTTLAAKIAAAIQADPTLRLAGVSASSAAAVVTVRQPGTLGNTLVLTSGVSGSLTLTVVQPANGTLAVSPRFASGVNIAALNTIA